MWIWVGETKGKAPLSGVPGRDLTDEEFKHYAAKVDADNPADLSGLERSGLYEHTGPRRKGDGEAATEVSNGGND